MNRNKQSWELCDPFGHIFSKMSYLIQFALFWSYFGYSKNDYFFKKRIFVS